MAETNEDTYSIFTINNTELHTKQGNKPAKSRRNSKFPAKKQSGSRKASIFASRKPQSSESNMTLDLAFRPSSKIQLIRDESPARNRSNTKKLSEFSRNASPTFTNKRIQALQLVQSKRDELNGTLFHTNELGSIASSEIEEEFWNTFHTERTSHDCGTIRISTHRSKLSKI